MSQITRKIEEYLSDHETVTAVESLKEDLNQVIKQSLVKR